MSLKSAEFPSSAAFQLISDSISSEAEKKAACKQVGAIIGFTLKNNGKEESWYLDMKDAGVVGKGPAPEGKKADVTLSLSDADFTKLVDGKAKAQQLFMSGKLKIKGNMMKATKLEPVLSKASQKAKL